MASLRSDWDSVPSPKAVDPCPRKLSGLRLSSLGLVCRYPGDSLPGKKPGPQDALSEATRPSLSARPLPAVQQLVPRRFPRV
jgi:hypothetical protein